MEVYKKNKIEKIFSEKIDCQSDINEIVALLRRYKKITDLYSYKIKVDKSNKKLLINLIEFKDFNLYSLSAIVWNLNNWEKYLKVKSEIKIYKNKKEIMDCPEKICNNELERNFGVDILQGKYYQERKENSMQPEAKYDTGLNLKKIRYILLADIYNKVIKKIIMMI